MVRCLGKGWGLVATVAALSAGAGLQVHVVAATTSVDVGDLYPDCRAQLQYVADGYCDTFGDEDNNNNVEECGFDGGDCCSCTCVSGSVECSDKPNSYNCLDTSVACYEEPGPTPGPVAAEEAEAEDDNAASFLKLSAVTTSGTAAAAGAFAVTALCGGFAAAVGW